MKEKREEQEMKNEGVKKLLNERKERVAREERMRRKSYLMKEKRE